MSKHMSEYRICSVGWCSDCS